MSSVRSRFLPRLGAVVMTLKGRMKESAVRRFLVVLRLQYKVGNVLGTDLGYVPYGFTVFGALAWIGKFRIGRVGCVRNGCTSSSTFLRLVHVVIFSATLVARAL